MKVEKPAAFPFLFSSLRFLQSLSVWLEPETENSDEPFYDPVHLAALLISIMAAMGALYWLLWTVLVYEGGLPLKVRDAAQVLFSSRTLASFGWEGWDEPGQFKGWTANVVALLLCGLLVFKVQRLLQKTGGRDEGAGVRDD